MTNSFVNIEDLQDFSDQTVRLRGWLYGKRSGGKVVFLILRDGTGLCQCVVEAKTPEAFQAAHDVFHEGSLIIEGRVRLDDRAPGGVEIAASRVQIIQSAEGYPIARKEHGVDFLLSHRHLWLRTPRQSTILRIRHTLIDAIRAFFDDRGFTLIDTPVLSPGAAEGSGSLFPVDYFGDEVYLAQTGQLYLEGACMALGRVYCFGPTFRAEKSKTRRHLTEFWMVEPEVAFAALPDLVQLAEDFICEIVGTVLSRHRDDLTALDRDITPLERVCGPFPRLTYSEAVDLLHSDELQARQEEQLEIDSKQLEGKMEALGELEEQRASARKGWQKDKLDDQIHGLREELRELELDLQNRPEHIRQARAFEWGKDLGGDEESLISKWFDKPVFITEYPREAKAFYMKQSETDPRVVLNLDMLAPEGYGEIIGGSQREDDLDRLLERMKAEQMDTAPYEWYLDLRRYGSVPHGGFGLGVERTLAWICGLRHIREAIPFPRLMGRIYP